MILMLPVCDMRIFSILRSETEVFVSEAVHNNIEQLSLTTMDNIILMAIVKCTTNLPRELPCDAFP